MILRNTDRHVQRYIRVARNYHLFDVKKKRENVIDVHMCMYEKIYIYAKKDIKYFTLFFYTDVSDKCKYNAFTYMV